MKILGTLFTALSISQLWVSLTNGIHVSDYNDVSMLTKRVDDPPTNDEDATPHKVFFLSNLAFLRESDYNYDPMGPSFAERLSTLNSNLTDIKESDTSLIQDIGDLYTQITELEENLSKVERLLTKGMRRLILSYSKSQLRVYNLTRETRNLEDCKRSLRAELKALDIVRASSTGQLLHFIKEEFTKHNLWEDTLRFVGEHRKIVKRAYSVESQKYLQETLITIVKALIFVGICYSINSIICTSVFVVLTTVQIIVWVLVLTEMQVDSLPLGSRNTGLG